jgi:CRP-like cAMP-binding protein
MTGTGVQNTRPAIPIRGWFGAADPDFRRELLALARPKSLPAGSAIYHAGDAGPDVYGIRSGIVLLQCRFVHPDSVLLHMLHAGDWLGTAPVLVNATRRVSAVARTDVELLRVPGDDLRALLLRRPEWVAELARDVLHYLDLSMQDPAARCAAVLLRLAGHRWGSDPAAGAPAEIPASQAELAMLCNVSRNTFGRVVNAFAARRIVEIHYRSMRVLQPAALRAIADGA